MEIVIPGIPAWVSIVIYIITGSLGTMVIKSIIDHILNKKKNDAEIKGTSIENDSKIDNYWENRFKGLKQDYEDREKYHNGRYEELKTTYEEKYDFKNQLLEKTKRELSEITDLLNAKIEYIKKCEDTICKKDEKIIELTNQVLRLSGNFIEAPVKEIKSLDNYLLPSDSNSQIEKTEETAQVEASPNSNISKQ